MLERRVRYNVFEGLVDVVQALVVPVFFNSNPEVSFSDFGTLEGVRKAFANKDVVLGAW